MYKFIQRVLKKGFYVKGFMFTYIHTYIHTYVHIYVHTYVNV